MYFIIIIIIYIYYLMCKLYLSYIILFTFNFEEIDRHVH